MTKIIDLSNKINIIDDTEFIFDDCITSKDIDDDKIYIILVQRNPIWKNTMENIWSIVQKHYFDINHYNVFIYTYFHYINREVLKKEILNVFSGKDLTTQSKGD